MKKSVFAIVIIYNGMQKQWIQKCFDSLLKSSININIIAIDNLSSDGSVEFIKENYPMVELIESEVNFGFGKANNIGIQKAYERGADYFFLLNQDAWVQENTVEILIENSILHPEYGILSPLHMNGERNLIDEGFYNCINPSKSRKLYSMLFTHRYNDKTILNFDFVPAACWLLPKATIMNIGGFNPTFYHYAEDDNYTHRLKYHKMKVGVVPAVEVCHDREERPPNICFDALLTKYERRIVLELSNPLLKGNRKLVHYRLLVVSLIQSGLFFDFNTFKLTCKKFGILFKIKEKNILLNKEISKEQGPSFLFKK